MPPMPHALSPLFFGSVFIRQIVGSARTRVGPCTLRSVGLEPYERFWPSLGREARRTLALPMGRATRHRDARTFASLHARM